MGLDNWNLDKPTGVTRWGNSVKKEKGSEGVKRKNPAGIEIWKMMGEDREITSAVM